MEKIGLSDIMARFEAGHGGAWWRVVESGTSRAQPWFHHCSVVSVFYPPMNSFYCQERLIMVPKAGHRMIF